MRSPRDPGVRVSMTWTCSGRVALPRDRRCTSQKDDQHYLVRAEVGLPVKRRGSPYRASPYRARIRLPFSILTSRTDRSNCNLFQLDRILSTKGTATV